MTGPTGSDHMSLVLLELGSMTCVIDSQQVNHIASAPGHAGIDIDATLGASSPNAPSRALDVNLDGVSVRCLTRATLRPIDLPTRQLFALPRILRQAGCANWIRGLAILGAPGQRSFGLTTVTQSLVLWVDLLALAKGGIHG